MTVIETSSEIFFFFRPLPGRAVRAPAPAQRPPRGTPGDEVPSAVGFVVTTLDPHSTPGNGVLKPSE